MPKYRLYTLNSEQKVHSASDSAFRSDDEAMAEAYNMATKCPGVEVWCGVRMVARIPNIAPNHPKALPVEAPDAA